jgi:hypothetical protein
VDKEEGRKGNRKIEIRKEKRVNVGTRSSRRSAEKRAERARPLQNETRLLRSGFGGGLCAGFVDVVDVEGRVEEENCGAGFRAGALGLVDVF